jgi:hypothetical protein
LFPDPALGTVPKIIEAPEDSANVDKIRRLEEAVILLKKKNKELNEDIEKRRLTMRIDGEEKQPRPHRRNQLRKQELASGKETLRLYLVRQGDRSHTHCPVNQQFHP